MNFNVNFNVLLSKYIVNPLVKIKKTSITSLFLSLKNLRFLVLIFCYLEVTFVPISFFETFPILRRQSYYISPYRLFLLRASY